MTDHLTLLRLVNRCAREPESFSVQSYRVRYEPGCYDENDDPLVRQVEVTYEFDNGDETEIVLQDEETACELPGVEQHLIAASYGAAADRAYARAESGYAQ